MPRPILPWFAALPLVLALSGLPLNATKPLAWERGTVMNITGGSTQITLNKRVKNKRFSKRKYSWEFNIDDGSSVIMAEYRGLKPLAVDKGGLVSFAVLGDELVLRDPHGRRHNLDLVSRTAK
ncbi:MAG TPA: hypothetical protein VG168_07630 [Bryobacteraceae bacterium]|jgi:hypothetical protein|nr:hypothetical protein [Bryobacteraceae bacterium]